jgi:hypothetical protein
VGDALEGQEEPEGEEDNMNDSDRDRLIIETANDVKWIKNWTVGHKALHSKYTYFFFITLVGLIIALIK